MPKINNMTKVNTITEIVSPIIAQILPVLTLFSEPDVKLPGLERYNLISRLARTRAMIPVAIPAKETKCHQQSRIDKIPRTRIKVELGRF